MTKRKHGVGFGAPVIVCLTAPLFIGAIIAACGGNGSSNAGGTGGDHGSSTGSMGGGNGSGMAQSGSNASGSNSVSSSGSGMPMPCMSDGDCANDPAGHTCDTTKGTCVGCLPANDTCPMGQYCDPATNDCAMGCKGDADCGGGMSTHCDPQAHTCVDCLTDNDCALATICSGGTCTPGCTAAHGCNGSDTCCTGVCADLGTSLGNCGACGKVCPVPDNAAPTCANGMCGMGACNMGWADCDTQSANGCEWNVLLDDNCKCVPGATQACYNGAPGTKGVGPCKAGITTCNAMGSGWGPCLGEVIPQPETVCNGAVDLDCDGIAGNVADVDGDGWTVCNGDCCETVAQCPSPALVNPGAFEVLNNGINDDCDAATSDSVPPASCINAQKFAGVTGLDVAHAMDICQSTTANPPLPTKKWGLISAGQYLANGVAAAGADLTNIQNSQNAILQNYGTGGIVPHKGPTMAGMSSGAMRDANDPGFVVPVIGTDFLRTLAFPGGPPLSTYLAAHGGGLLPGSCSGVACAVGTGANDSVNLRLVIRVPTNAKSFSYDFRFFSGEYQTFQCTQYNDYYLAMLTTGAAGIPADHNISFDANNNAVSVNNGFFQVCTPNGKGCGGCVNGAAELAGTGMDQVSGGGTAWLTTDAPIVPGETMTLELLIFDVSDGIYDSLVLLDNFRWNLAPAVVNTHQ